MSQVYLFCLVPGGGLAGLSVPGWLGYPPAAPAAAPGRDRPRR